MPGLAARPGLARARGELCAAYGLVGSEERPAMKPFAPIHSYGGRAELKGLLRLALLPIIDVRDPVQRARDRIAARAELVNV